MSKVSLNENDFKLEEDKVSLISTSGGTGGGIDYSLEEQNTGRKWIDGKDIYCKTVDFGYFSTTQRYTQIPHNIPLDTCIKIEGTSSIPSANFYVAVAWAQPLEELPMKAIDFDMDNTKFECVYTLTPDNAQYKAVATYYYTKKEGNE